MGNIVLENIIGGRFMEAIERFRDYLRQEEKCELTVEKYVRDVLRFLTWLGDAELTKERTLAYKAELVEQYAVLTELLSGLYWQE